jgi:hypothetical protein
VLGVGIISCFTEVAEVVAEVVGDSVVVASEGAVIVCGGIVCDGDIVSICAVCIVDDNCPDKRAASSNGEGSVGAASPEVEKTNLEGSAMEGKGWPSNGVGAGVESGEVYEWV